MLLMHLIKTGGTTLRSSLGACFGGRYVDLSAASGHAGALSPKLGYIRGILRNDPDVCAIGGHNIWVHPEDFRSGRIRFFPVLFVRSWFDWLVSYYYYVRSHRNRPGWLRRVTNRDVAVILSGSLGEYLRFASTSGRTVCSRLPVMALRSRGRTTRDQFMRYVGMYHMGVTERYDESAVVIEHELAPHFPDLDLSYARPANANPLKRTHISPYESERGSVNAETLRLLEELHADTAWLYDYANAELDRKISNISDFGRRLEDFRLRCKMGVRG